MYHLSLTIRNRTVTSTLRTAAFRPIPGNCSSLDCRHFNSGTVVSLSADGEDLKTRKRRRPIYVSATREHVGKTTTSLALISGLQKRFPKTIGYLKPVGQRHVKVHSDELDTEIRVDKDVALIRERCNLQHIDYRYMSPVLIPQGYTKDYIDGKISHTEQIYDIQRAVEYISSCSDVVICEGTGHCGVGSIVGASNARVASLTNATMVLIANGGLGSCFDELELNRILCKHHNVDVAGVIINKVLPEKYEQTKDYMSRALMNAWNVPLLGCIPDKPYLGCPALNDLENLLQSKLINGEKHRFRHYTLDSMCLVTESLPTFLKMLRTKPSQTLYLCHVTRDDIILGFLAEFQRRKRLNYNKHFEAALIICGENENYSLTNELRAMLTQDEDTPLIICPYSTDQAMDMIHSMTPKLNISDSVRVNAATEHYEEYIDYDLLLSRTDNIN